MARANIGVLATIGRVPFACLVCKSGVFYDRTIVVALRGHASGYTATVGLICVQCGYIHQFMNNQIEFWKPEHGYPS